jgi:glucoamylase
MLTRCISATDLVMVRKGFDQTIVPKRGSVLGAFEIASYDPDPDYFFHWLRDSSLVIDALRILIVDGLAGPGGLASFMEFIRFSLGLRSLRGGSVLRHRDPREGVEPAFRRYVRSRTDLRQVRGDRALGEARYNPDGTLDTIRWSRPQHDGPALRALAVLRYRALMPALGEDDRTAVRALLHSDLDFTLRHWREPCFDLWEEDFRTHYYTRLVQSAALAYGAAWAAGAGDNRRARRYRTAADKARRSLHRHWRSGRDFYCSRWPVQGSDPDKALDISAVLAVLHADLRTGPHSVLDPRAQATLHRLEQLFAAEYAINRLQSETTAPAMGRYKGDRYFSGGAYYLATLAAAEFYYRLAEAVAQGYRLERTACNQAFIDGVPKQSSVDSPFRPDAFMRRGDAFMETVRRFTPGSGELSEQFDQSTGVQSSGKNLAWSYAAFVTARDARRRARDAVRTGTVDRTLQDQASHGSSIRPSPWTR